MIFALFAFIVGVAVSISVVRPGNGNEEKGPIPQAQPVGESFPVPDALEESVPEETSGDLSTASEEAATEKASPEVPEGQFLGLEVTPAGTGKAFDDADLEWVRSKTGGKPVVSEDEKDIMDSLDPRLKKAVEEAGDFVEEVDEKTLDITSDILEVVPFLNLKPEKAEIRPNGGGATLTIELSPEALGINTGKKTAPETASSDEAPAEQPEEDVKVDSQDEGGEGNS